MVYVASAYSSKKKYPLNKIEEYIRYRAVTKCIGKLHDRYPFAFIGPITQSHNTAWFTTTKSGGFEHWKTIDLTYISRCDEMWLFMNDGWNESVGVREELMYCFEHMIPIRLINPKTLRVRKLKKIKACISTDKKELRISLV
jgi:hypothetical protein